MRTITVEDVVDFYVLLYKEALIETRVLLANPLQDVISLMRRQLNSSEFAFDLARHFHIPYPTAKQLNELAVSCVIEKVLGE